MGPQQKVYKKIYLVIIGYTMDWTIAEITK